MSSYLDIAASLIARFEGFESKAYPDPLTGAEPITIGFGTIKYPDGSKVKMGDDCTEEQAKVWLMFEIEKKCLRQLERIPTWPDMNDNQKAALLSFAYNLGAHFYRASNFTSISRVCDQPGDWHDHEWVKDQFVKYRNPGSDVEAGLKRRREAEADLFNSTPKG